MTDVTEFVEPLEEAPVPTEITCTGGFEVPLITGEA